MKHSISSLILLRYIVLIFSLWVYVSIIIDILKGLNLTISIIFPSSREIIYNLLEEGEWLFNVWYEITPENTFSFYVILITEIVIFIGGLTLFLISFINSIYARRANITIVNSGLYKFIRHPQNVGIFLTALPCVFYAPGSDELRIQIGGILLRLLFILCMIVCSDLQELNVQKKFPKEFSNYRKNVGFFFPKIRRNQLKKKLEKKKNYFLRYYLLFLGYFFTILIIEAIIDFLLFVGIGRFIVYL